MTKLKNTDEKCGCEWEYDNPHLTSKTFACGCSWEFAKQVDFCDNCNPEKQGDDWGFHIQDYIETFIKDEELGYIFDKPKFDQFIRQVEKQTRESVVEEFVNGLIEASRVGNEYHIEIIGEAVWGIREKLKQKTKE